MSHTQDSMLHAHTSSSQTQSTCTFTAAICEEICAQQNCSAGCGGVSTTDGCIEKTLISKLLVEVVCHLVRSSIVPNILSYTIRNLLPLVCSDLWLHVYKYSTAHQALAGHQKVTERLASRQGPNENRTHVKTLESSKRLTELCVYGMQR